MSTIDSTSTSQRGVYRKVTDGHNHQRIEQVSATGRCRGIPAQFAFSPIKRNEPQTYTEASIRSAYGRRLKPKAMTSQNGLRTSNGRNAEHRSARERSPRRVVFCKFASDAKETEDRETLTNSRLLFTRGYSVFNAAQVDGYTPKPEIARPMPERFACVDAFSKAIGADVSHGGNRAYYAPAADHIQMPPVGAFEENVAYYSTLAHEH